jgi:branched-chain amino acid transport system substrate-binding protein
MTSALAGEIKVGAAAGFTGPAADIAALNQRARQLAVDQVNAQGGLFDNQTLRLILGDSGCDPKGGVDAGNKLVNVEQVVSIVGPECSGETLAMAQSVTIPEGVVVLSDSATSPKISTLKDNDTVFRTVASDGDQGRALVDVVMKAGFKDVAVITVNDDYNMGVSEVFQRDFLAAGGKISAKATVEGKKASYRADLASLSSGGGKGIVVFAYYASGGLTIMKNSLEAGLFDTFFGAGGMTGETVVADLGVENIKDRFFVVTPASDPEDPSYKAYATAMTKANVNPEDAYNANSYDTVFLMALAIEKAGVADRSKISAALREVAGPGGEKILPGEWSKAKALIKAGKKINYEGASGNLDFDANGDVTGVFGVTTVNDEGKFTKKVIK